MAGIFMELDSPALIINSMPDHIHTLFRLSKNVTVAKLMEEVKKSSSKWMKRQPLGINSFYWQKGYGAFAVNVSHLDIVTRYIAHQKKHHQTMTYKEEIEKLMGKYNVNEYNPDFYWE